IVSIAWVSSTSAWSSSSFASFSNWSILSNKSIVHLVFGLIKELKGIRHYYLFSVGLYTFLWKILLLVPFVAPSYAIIAYLVSSCTYWVKSLILSREVAAPNLDTAFSFS